MEKNDQKPVEEIKKEGTTEETEIEIVNAEIIEPDIYTGEIVSDTSKDGFVFIGHVMLNYARIATNGDVFAPIPEGATYEIGQKVQFSKLDPDPKRPNKFRTENIIILDESTELSASQTKAISIVNLSKQISPYHKLKKIIEEGDIEKAADNKPLAEFIVGIQEFLNTEKKATVADLQKRTEEFVQENFASLIPLEVDYSIQGNVDTAGELKKIQEAIKLYRANGLDGQAESLEKEYSQFLKTRNAFTIMLSFGLLRPDTIIPLKHLPELTVAFPVLFVKTKDEIQDTEREEDPRPDSVVRFFADAVGSREFAWFYEIYNRRTRPINKFSGRDIIPPQIVKIMAEAEKIFDVIAIMTPYHDLASREWSDPNWLRNLDPLMVGFLKGLPCIFVLGRWSGTGVFPLMLDCIADTMNHLRINQESLSNFPANAYWYHGSRPEYQQKNLLEQSALPRYAEKLLLAYENGKLFEFLRGELSENEEYLF